MHLLVCALLSSFWTAFLPAPNRYGHLDYGRPSSPDQYLERRGYTIGYMKKWRQAAWASYRLTDMNVFQKTCLREDCFTADPDIEENAVQPYEYSSSGYDRGHLVPAEDMRYDQLCMVTSFYMSNMSPQIGSFNRGIWKRLEKVVRKFALKERKITIVTGPVFDKNVAHRTFKNIPVPERFYKVILDETEPIKMIGFIVPNRQSLDQVWNFAVSVSDVEVATGLNFFEKLPKEVRQNLKPRVRIADWDWGNIDIDDDDD